MSRTESDLFNEPSPEDALVQDFTMSRRGYDPDEVRNHIARLASRIEGLEGELRDSKGQLEAARRASADLWKQAYAKARDNIYTRLSARMMELLSKADQTAEETVHDAQERAKATVAEANTEAERIRREAWNDSERMRREADEARAEADAQRQAILSDLRVRHDALLDDARSSRDRLASVVAALTSLEAARATVPLPEPARPAEVEPATGFAEPQGAAVVEIAQVEEVEVVEADGTGVEVIEAEIPEAEVEVAETDGSDVEVIEAEVVEVTPEAAGPPPEVEESGPAGSPESGPEDEAGNRFPGDDLEQTAAWSGPLLEPEEAGGTAPDPTGAGESSGEILGDEDLLDDDFILSLPDTLLDDDEEKDRE